MTKAVIITKYGKIKDINITKTKKINKLFKNKGKGKYQIIHKWNKKKIILFGYVKGNENDINKHEFPPPIDNNLYFGDILIIKNKNNNIKNLNNLDNIINFDKKDYNTFYNNEFKGFENLNDTLQSDNQLLNCKNKNKNKNKNNNNNNNNNLYDKVYLENFIVKG